MRPLRWLFAALLIPGCGDHFAHLPVDADGATDTGEALASSEEESRDEDWESVDNSPVRGRSDPLPAISGGTLLVIRTGKTAVVSDPDLRGDRSTK